jgi:hypothetical protein
LAGVSDAQAIYGDPQFVNVDSSNFSLQKKSPAIDAGVEVGLPYAGAAPDLGAIEFGGTPSGVNEPLGPAQGFQLYQNYPNPFNPTTKIAYEVFAPSLITLRVYGLTGQSIKTLVDEKQNSGAYTVQWDGNDIQGEKVSSGVYFYQLTVSNLSSPGISAIRKMALLR